MKMKIADMTERQKKAYRNIIGAANDFIGGLENTMEDSPEDSEEYINAKETLDNHDELVDFIYQEAISNVYNVGHVSFGTSAEAYIKDIRFCGKEWLMERVKNRVTKMGY